MTTNVPLWQPTRERVARANITEFTARIARGTGRAFPDYKTLWRWSNDEHEAFWRAIWDYAGIVGERGERTLIDGHKMPGARWFPDACLNFAENLRASRGGDDAVDALVFRGEDRDRRHVTFRELTAMTSRMAAALQASGVTAGDRVAGYIPNLPEAIIAMLGVTSFGAVWSSCSPDFGVRGVLDRFGQIEPRVLVTVDGYWYNGKALPIVDKVAQIVAELPTVERVIVIPYLERSGGPIAKLSAIRGAIRWDDYVAPHAAGTIAFAKLPFDHPVYILYSSGTTGVPKCIVHGAGGTLLQHVKELLLHGDLKRGDRLFYFTTCGWMMWNWLASGLACRATLLLYDGSPSHPPGTALFGWGGGGGGAVFGFRPVGKFSRWGGKTRPPAARTVRPLARARDPLHGIAALARG